MEKISISVLGSGCSTCKTLYNTVLRVAQKINPNLEVEYITDITKIVELGTMSSPVFAINHQIITAGKLPSEKEIENSILKKLRA